MKFHFLESSKHYHESRHCERNAGFNATVHKDDHVTRETPISALNSKIVTEEYSIRSKTNTQVGHKTTPVWLHIRKPGY